MLQAKYKAHKFVNLIFYFLIFVFGVVVGFGLKKLDLKEVFSKVLMIDNVNAYTIYEKNDIKVDEELIYDLFSSFDGWSYEKMPYILCKLDQSSNPTSISCQSFSTLNYFYYINWSSYVARIGKNSGDLNYLSFTYTFSSKTFTYSEQRYIIDPYSGSNSNSFTTISYNKSGSAHNYSNFNPSEISGFPSNYDSSINKLDFSSYSDNPTLNDGSIFTNAPNYDFNKYCWDFTEETLFTVLPKKSLYDTIDLNNTDGEYTFRNGFYSFGNVGNFGNVYNIERGKITRTWYAPKPNVLTHAFGEKFENLNNITHTFDYLNNDTALQNRYNNLFDGLFLFDTLNNNTYYEDNLDLFLYSHFFETEYYFNASGQYSYDIFKYRPNCVSDGEGIGGTASSGRTCTLQNGDVHLELLEPLNANICIFVPKDYDVSILTENSQDGITGTVLLPNGEDDVYTSAVSREEELMPQINSIFDALQSSDYGLIRILQAPLVVIDKIRTGVCEPYVIPLFDTNITLPCGDTIFWGREDVQSFRIWWNMFFGGILAYGFGISIYKSIKSLKDPNNDKVEVIDL